MTLAEFRESFVLELESFQLPVYLQGSMSEGEDYPDTFLTYYIQDDREESHADNSDWLKSYTVQVAVYSNDIDVKDRMIENIRQKLKANDYKYQLGGDVESDTSTHTGYMQQFIKAVQTA